VTRNAGIARIMRMSYRSKTYTWNDVILVKGSMIREFVFILCYGMYEVKGQYGGGIRHTSCCVQSCVVAVCAELPTVSNLSDRKFHVT